MNQDTVRLRAIVAPEPSYPAPWLPAEERNGKIFVTDATGGWVAECQTTEAAEIIVAAVNEFASSLDLVHVLLCPLCRTGVIWSTDEGAACMNPDPDAAGSPGCGAEWNSVGRLAMPRRILCPPPTGKA
jgi:hypothetical protein